MTSQVCVCVLLLLFSFFLAGHISCQRGPDYITNLKNLNFPVFQFFTFFQVVVVVVHFTFHGSAIDLLTTRRDITDTIFHAPAHSTHAEKYIREKVPVFVK